MAELLARCALGDSTGPVVHLDLLGQIRSAGRCLERTHTWPMIRMARTVDGGGLNGARPTTRWGPAWAASTMRGTWRQGGRPCNCCPLTAWTGNPRGPGE